MTAWCRITGRAGQITLQRPDALNALTHEMCQHIEAALDDWRGKVDLIVLDADGDKAFCAGGDVTALYASSGRNDLEFGRRFWRDEYRLNAKLAAYPVPIVSFLQGFTMGGGVGLGCHVSHRIVCETSQIAMPECSIGLVPDVGGSGILARAPGRLGAYLGTTGARMGPAEAIHVGFADTFVPAADWDTLKSRLVATCDASFIAAASASAGDCAFPDGIDTIFAGADLSAIKTRLDGSDDIALGRARAALDRNAPLAMSAFLAMLDHLGDTPDLRQALTLEYRYTHRAVAQGDFIEGVRAAIIDKDRQPKWHFAPPDTVPLAAINDMLAPLGPNELMLEDMT